MCKSAKQDLMVLRNPRERVKKLEKNRGVLLNSIANRVLHALYELIIEEKTSSTRCYG